MLCYVMTGDNRWGVSQAYWAEVVTCPRWYHASIYAAAGIVVGLPISTAVVKACVAAVV